MTVQTLCQNGLAVSDIHHNNSSPYPCLGVRIYVQNRYDRSRVCRSGGKVHQCLDKIDNNLGKTVESRVILIIGSKKDPVINCFVNKLSQQKKRWFKWVDEDEFGRSVHINDKGWDLGSSEIQHTAVVAVWNRLLGSSRERQKKSVSDYAHYLLDYVYPCVLNRPMHGMSNHAKQYQMNLLRTKRLKKIDSYIFANAILGKEVEQGHCIFKSMSGVRSVVQRVPDKCQHWFVKEPVLFQPCIQGVNIRVHVIGQKVIACCCISDAIDYRYGTKIKIRPHILPKEIELECIEISQQLSLFFTGVDLIQNGDSYYLLEVNPAPGYSVFDKNGLITRALVAFFDRCLQV